MFSKKKYVLILAVLATVLLSSVGLSTWIITKGVDIFTEYRAPVLIKATASPIDITYNEFDTYVTSNSSVTTRKHINTNLAKLAETKLKLTFTNPDGNVSFPLVYGKDYTYTVSTFSDGNFDVLAKTSDTSVGCTYEYGVTVTLLNYGYKFNSGDGVKVYVSNLLKYRTAQIYTSTTEGESGIWKTSATFYTVEEALALSGNVVLAGSNTSAQARTAFTSLPDVQQPDKDKYISSGYTSLNRTVASGETLRVPFADYNLDKQGTGGLSGDTGEGFDAFAVDSSFNGVYSTLYIPSTVILNVQGKLNVGSLIVSTGSLKSRGVIMNSGTINISSNAELSCYGYLKGTGSVNLSSGATCYDVLTVYDWTSGSQAFGAYSEGGVFPMNAYSTHNNACTTTIAAGAFYKAYYAFSLSGGGVNLWLKGYFNLIGQVNSSSSSLFELSSGTIVKSATEKTGDTAFSTVTALNSAKTQRDLIKILGVCTDNSITINLTADLDLGTTANIAISTMKVPEKIVTSTDLALPVGYMDIVIANKASLALNSASYKILPGATVTVQNGGTLTVDGNTSLTFFGEQSSTVDYTKIVNGFVSGKYCQNNVAAELKNNGTVEVTEYASISGKISTEQAGAITTINGTPNTSNTYITNFEANEVNLLVTTITLWSPVTATCGESEGSIANGNIIHYTKTSGDTLTIANTENKSLEQIEYVSVEVGGKYYWAKAKVSANQQASDGTLTLIAPLPAGTELTANTLDAYGYALTSAKYGDVVLFDSSTTGSVVYDDFIVNATKDDTAEECDITYYHNNNDTTAKTEVSVVDKALSSFFGLDLYGNEIVPEYLGHKFLGWAETEAKAEAKELLTAESFASLKTEGVTQITVYAAWEPIYTITFNANSSESIATLPTVYRDLAPDGNTYNVPSDELTWTGYKFLGWSLTQIAVDGANTETEFITTVDKYDASGLTITLYAVWERKYELIFNPSNGTQSGTFMIPESLQQRYDATANSIYLESSQIEGIVTLLSTAKATPSDNNYLFNGWTKNQGGIDYITGDNPITIGEFVNKQFTAYAAYREADKLVFNINGGGNTAPTTATSDFAVLTNYVSLPTTTHTGKYYLLGWATTATATTPTVLTDNTVLNVGTNFTGAHYKEVFAVNGTTATSGARTATLYAVWKAYPTLTISGSGFTSDIASGTQYAPGDEVTITITTSATGEKFTFSWLVYTQKRDEYYELTKVEMLTSGNTRNDLPSNITSTSTVNNITIISAAYTKVDNDCSRTDPSAPAKLVIKFTMPTNNLTINITTTNPATSAS